MLKYRNHLILLIFFFLTLNINAQDYFIGFSQNNPSNTIIDSVKVENLSRNTSLVLNGNDILHLVLNTSILETQSLESSFKLFPNPMNNEAEINFYLPENNLLNINIFDLTGKCIINSQAKYSIGLNKIKISGFQKGIYILNISGKGINHTSKFVSLSPNANDPKVVNQITSEINLKSNKSLKSVKDMSYSSGEVLKFTGYFNNCTNIITETANTTKTLVFTFASCNLVLTTSQTSNKTAVSAEIGGNVSSNSGINEWGICWSSQPNPTISENKKNVYIDGTSFQTTIKWLMPNTTYYARAYVLISGGTVYGNEIAFTTLSTIPSINYLGTLYVAPIDIAEAIRWGDGITLATSCTNGESNTSKIVTANGNNNNEEYAAMICDTLNLAGFSDWYLPGQCELNEMYTNRNTIGNFDIEDYWGSTEDLSESGVVYAKNFDNGDGHWELKYWMMNVRCVRR